MLNIYLADFAQFNFIASDIALRIPYDRSLLHIPFLVGEDLGTLAAFHLRHSDGKVQSQGIDFYRRCNRG